MKPVPRAILDVDGVVADFLGHVLGAVGYEHGRETIKDYDFRAALTLAQQEKMTQVLADSTFWETIPIIPGALEGVDNIRSEGHELIWATSPWVPCRGWESVRREWLKRYFDVEPDEIVFTFQKHILTADFFIDDRPDSVVAWQRAHSHGIAFLFDAPYNAQFLWPRRMHWEVETDGSADAQDAIREREG